METPAAFLNRAWPDRAQNLGRRVLRRARREIGIAIAEFRTQLFRASAPQSNQAELAPAFWRSPAFEAWGERLQALCPNDSASERLIVVEAERICDHVFDLLGSGARPLGPAIDWHVDFKTGRRFNPGMYYKRIHPASYPGGYDIKVPWELSRCHHLVRLGQAWRTTRDEKYAHEFVSQIKHWIVSNPYPYGVNWANAMEVGIRAANWLSALALMIDAPDVTDEYLVVLAQSLFTHASHILNNLENPADETGNHYIADLVGLVHLGVGCSFFDQAQFWVTLGTTELWKEMLRQVNSDGADFEGAIAYHGLVAEMLLSTIWLCQNNYIPVPQAVLERVAKMLEFNAHYTKPDGTVPLIGDQDNGCLHRLKVWPEPSREWVDHSYLGELGRQVFELPRAAGERLSSRAFEASGFYFMRHQDLYLAMRTRGDGQIGSGGHTHNDIFSFELFAYDKTFIVDPGTFAYTSDYTARNRFRSSRYHNVLVVDDEEINSIPQREPFRMGNGARVTPQHWETQAAYDLFEAEHTGYAWLKSPVQHRRAIYFDKRAGYWILRDDVIGNGNHTLSQYFHFAPVAMRQDAANPFVWTECEGANLGLYFIGMHAPAVMIEEGWVSSSYGVAQRAPVVNSSTRTELPYTFLTVLYPAKTKPVDYAQVLSQIAGHPWLQHRAEP